MKFNDIYNRQDFINFLKTKFFWEAFLDDYKTLNIERKSYFFEKDNCFQLWKANLDKEIAILEMKQKSKNDPRITLTRDAFKIMWDIWVNFALVIFYSDDSSSYRLSLLTSKVFFWEKEESDPKRYSFLLWEWEKIKTPLKYLNKKINSFNDLIDSFNVEVVRKEFFNHYLDLYIRLYKEVQKDRDFIKLLKIEKVDLVTFTKTLLWKIIFLYFIQKKGWLWVKRDELYWENGDKDFMRSIWNDFKNNEESLTIEKTWYFYNDYLEWLFYDWLNKDRRDSDDYYPNLKMKVPYLNGGLFWEDYKGWVENKAKISNDVFSNEDESWILDIFDRYNFTVDEDDLYDSEMAVDPEMLWRIFEKMISISSENIDIILEEYDKNIVNGRKKKITIDNILNKKLGAFYTPREIVAYMTKESLIAYLGNNLKGKKEEKEKQIRKIFEFKEKFLIEKSEITEEVFDELASIIEDIDNLLKKVKILDPAIWSWAFPMWILHEISSIRYYIYGVFHEFFWINTSKFKNKNWKVSMYKIKRDIIQNNIYGVDISSWAIDIARLRFWLSLVVDEENPEPLPNFEFKFVCANTLIPLAEAKDQKQIEFDWNKELNVETLKKYMVSYYNAQTNIDKEEWRKRIEKFLWIQEFAKTSLDLYWTKSERTKQLETYEPFNSNHNAEFFDPSLMMWNSKFDIIIGNPPYWVSIKWEYRKKIEKVFDKVPDYEIYYYFIEVAYKFLKKDWIKSYIIPNTVLFNVHAENFRNKLLKNWWIDELLDCTNFEIFENATVRNIITFFSKDNSKNFVWYRNTKDVENFKEFLRKKKETIIIKNLQINSKNWGLAFKLDKKNIDIVSKIKENSITINSVFPNISQWLIAYDKYKWQNEEIIKNRVYHYFSLEKEWLKKWLYWWDVKKYFMNWNWKEYIDYCDWIANWRTSNFFNENRILIREITNPSIFASYVEWEYYNDPAIINILEWELSLKYLLWLLNSKLITFYHFNSSPKATKWAFPKILVTDIKNFPIKEISQEKQKPFIEKVDKILEITKGEFYYQKNPPKEQLDL